MRQSVIGFIIILLGIFAYPVNGKTQAIHSLQQINQEASEIPSVTSLLIQQDGELISERYFHGMDEDDFANIKSASKSIISLLVGIAVDKEFLEGVNQPIGPFFKDYFQAHPDSVKENLTIKNLLTMQAGLETTSFHNYGAWVTSNDWVRFTLGQPMAARPGGDMAYSTGISHLLSVILTKATGQSTRAFANEHLFAPMGVTVGGWDRDPQGYYMGGNNMALRPAGMLKIGQMVMNKGIYQSKRIISEAWLQDSFQTYTRSNFNPYNYGYMWWKKPVGEFQVHFAWGFGGQYIFMIPDLNAVVVLTGSLQNADQSRSYKEPVFELLREDILPFLSQ
ncbi:serine hydrolase domain-containing protein [Fodinibius salsisoli]|uniref:Serine hydrolase n=1 Tax=Fodinibius salsisoli TaxID=2820877 RepID=A0ABT3PMI3_9BACT|nr:serine hydrolase [Fodinibius salsisoli]MCW9706928.1 serine hydrolase [Fodinibius salsisoli]